MPTAQVACKLTPLTCSTNLSLLGALPPNPHPFLKGFIFLPLFLYIPSSSLYFFTFHLPPFISLRSIFLPLFLYVPSSSLYFFTFHLPPFISLRSILLPLFLYVPFSFLYFFTFHPPPFISLCSIFLPLFLYIPPFLLQMYRIRVSKADTYML